jgi:hypothetical protein
MTNRVIRGQAFDEIHLSSVRTGVEFIEGVNNVKVEFRAEIQQLTKRPEDVYSDFLSALEVEAKAAPGVAVKAQSLQNRKTFDFTIYLAPTE